jgi:dephospho-CoA kinase
MFADVILVGLTGGIGSGKSTVSTLLAERGAVIIDADAVTKDLQRAGSPLLQRLAERFGAEIIGADGELHRVRLAEIAFADADALADLNKIVHPAVREEMARRMAAEFDTDRVVVLDVPLLAENPRGDTSGTVVVDVPVETQVERLVASRGFTEADARSRIARQATRAQRLAIADRVIDNSGTIDDLVAQVDDVWAWMQTLPAVAARFEETPDAADA